MKANLVRPSLQSLPWAGKAASLEHADRRDVVLRDPA